MDSNWDMYYVCLYVYIYTYIYSTWIFQLLTNVDAVSQKGTNLWRFDGKMPVWLNNYSCAKKKYLPKNRETKVW